MSNILTSNENELRLFSDAILINKSLPKWKNAEKGLEKTTIINNNVNSNTNTVLIGNPFIIPNAINSGTINDRFLINSYI